MNNSYLLNDPIKTEDKRNKFNFSVQCKHRNLREHLKFEGKCIQGKYFMALCICWLFVQQHSALQFCFHSLYKKYYFIISVPCHKCRGYVWTYWPCTSFRNPIISPYFPDGVHLNPCSQCSMQLSGSFLEGPSLALIFSPQAG